jgi:hypothetical protein
VPASAPEMMVAVAGAIVSVSAHAAVTVTVVGSEVMPSALAVISVPPGLTPVTTPVFGSTVPIPGRLLL